MTGRTGYPGQDRQNRTSTVERGKQNRTARTGHTERKGRTEKAERDRHAKQDWQNKGQDSRQDY
jgi:hypothetical protein